MKKINEKPRYGMRKLSVGFVSCLLGFSLMLGSVPEQAYANSVAKSTQRVLTQKKGSKSSKSKHDSVSSATYTYDRSKKRIEWGALKHAKGEDFGVWVNSTKYSKSNFELREENSFYKTGTKLYLNPGLKTDDKIIIRLEGKDFKIKYDGSNLLEDKGQNPRPSNEDFDTSPSEHNVQEDTLDGIKYNSSNQWIKWNSIKSDIKNLKGISVNEKNYRPVNIDHFHDIYSEGNNVYGYSQNKIAINPGLEDEDRISITIGNKTYCYEFNGNDLKHINTDALNKKKVEAKKEIEDLKYLDEKSKDDYKGKVDSAKNEGSIKSIVDKAKEENEKRERAKIALEASKNAGKDAIGKLKELSQEEKDQAIKDIDGATTKEKVKEIVDKAKTTNKEREDAKIALEASKNAGKEAIGKLKELSQEEKDQAIKDIDGATTKEKVKEIVDKAKEENEKRERTKAEKDALDKKKAEAKKEIEDLKYLDEKSKESYKGKVDLATNEENIKTIVEEAKSKDAEAKAEKDALDKKKEDAKKEIEDLKYLDEKSKESYKDKIDKVKNSDEIDKILEDAKEKNDKLKKDKENKPGEGSQTPGDATPGSGDQKPGEGSQTPGDVTPGSGDQKPGEGEQTPGELTPGSGDQKPGEGGESQIVDKEFAARVENAKKELKAYLDTMDENVLDNEAIEYSNDQVKPEIKNSIAKAKELLARDSTSISKEEVADMEAMPFKKVNGKKSGLFRDYTKRALVNFEVSGNRDKLNPHNNKKYVALKDNKIKIKSTLKDAGKIGENEKFFFKLNYVTVDDFNAKNASTYRSRSAEVEAVSSATPKYNKKELPKEDYTVKAVGDGYEIEINKLPENAKYIKPIVLVKFANGTYFENGDMVEVTESANTKPDTKPNNSDPVNPSEVKPGGEGTNVINENKPDNKPNPSGKENGSENKYNPIKFHEASSSSLTKVNVSKDSSKENSSKLVKAQEKSKSKHGAYIFGYGDKSFRPEGKISRAEAASMIGSLAGLDLDNKDKTNFKDTPNGWYNAAINAMVKNNLMFADEDGNFRPNEPITRAEFARALAGIDKKSNKSAPFADIKGHKFEDAINQVYGNGHIVGYPDGSFKPDGPITRAEAVTILNHFDGRSINKNDLEKIIKDFNNFTDVNENHWAYVQIFLAANDYQEILNSLAKKN